MPRIKTADSGSQWPKPVAGSRPAGADGASAAAGFVVLEGWPRQDDVRMIEAIDPLLPTSVPKDTCATAAGPPTPGMVTLGADEYPEPPSVILIAVTRPPTTVATAVAVRVGHISPAVAL